MTRHAESLVFKPGYRADVDGLRALAVIAVILNHYFPGVLPLGSLGVDVFFVISGYVITQGLMNDKSNGWVDFLLGFYSRRVRRLVPALLFCVLSTVVLIVFLTSGFSRDIFLTGGLSLFGLSNIYLYSVASDYFSVDAHLNPFTHTWSLGVEEQFYFIYPAIIVVCGFSFLSRSGASDRARRLLMVVGALSLAVYLLASVYDPMFAFYMVFPRFWEFCAGGLVFIGMSSGFNSFAGRRVAAVVAVCSFLLLLLVMFFSVKYIVLCTLLAVISTAGMIFFMGQGQSLHRFFSHRSIVFLGLLSYSLYLWHWPILVVGRFVLGESVQAYLLLIILTVLMALVSYFFVEKRFRYSALLQGNWRPFAFVILIVIPMSVFVVKSRGLDVGRVNFPKIFGVKEVESWAGKIPCHGGVDFTGGDSAEYSFLERCLKPDRSLETPYALFLLGDSHAAQLTFMLDEALADLPYQMRFANSGSKKDFLWSFMSGDVSSRTFDFVLESSKAGDVVMLAMHRGRLNDQRDAHIPINQSIDLGKKGALFQSGLEFYVDALLLKGVKVILVRDTPLMAAKVSSEACSLQEKLFNESSCRVSRSQDHHTRQRLDTVFDSIRQGRDGVYIWDPSGYFFTANGYADVVDDSGAYVMMDAHHITREKSAKLAPMFTEFFEKEVFID